MRKILMVTAFMGLSSFVMAQKGSWYMGGSVGYSNSKVKSNYNNVNSDSQKDTYWNVSPEFGTFLTDHWQLGLAISLSGSKNDPGIANYTDRKTNYYGGTLYTRYFFGSGAFKPFVGANAGVFPGNSKEDEVKYSNFIWRVNTNAGFGYALSKKVTAVGSFGMLGFQQTRIKEKGTDNKTTTNEFGFDASSLGDRFTIGIYFTL